MENNNARDRAIDPLLFSLFKQETVTTDKLNRTVTIYLRSSELRVDG